MVFTKGHRLPEEAKAKMRASLTGRKLSEETKAKMRAVAKTPEHNAKVSEALKGKTKTAEHRKNLSEANKKKGKMSYEEKRKRQIELYTARQLKEAGRPKPKNCELCGRAGRICFDHCHLTGLFRGWICSHCNTILGLANDSAKLLDKLAAYLRAQY